MRNSDHYPSGPAPRTFVFALISLAFCATCAGLNREDALAEAAPPEGWRRLQLPAPGAHGIFDPSIARAPGQSEVWMSYSAVDPSYRWPIEHPHTVSTRLARSTDDGETWSGTGHLTNRATDESSAGASVRIEVLRELATNWRGAEEAFTWNHEVASLVYDPGESSGEHWKLFWHRYPLIDGERAFPLGWIAYKQAASPEALAGAPETKLFVGAGYDTRADAFGGAPRIDLAGFHGDLPGCLFFTEPAAQFVDGELYLALHCADGVMPYNGRIVLLGFRNGVWNYRGTLLDNRRDSALLGGAGDFHGFSAPELIHLPQIDRTFLVVTPTTPRGYPTYHGCFVLRITDISRAMVLRDNLTPRLVVVSNGDSDSHNGACTYLDTSGGGLIQGQVYPQAIDAFRLYRTEQLL